MRITLFAAGILGAVLGQTACKREAGTSDPSGECSGKCGKGTRCDGTMCVVDYSQDICASPVETKNEPVVEMRPPITNWGECWEDRNQLPKKFKPVDDSDIPQYDPDRARALDWNEGDEQLTAPVLNAHMREIEYDINACLGIAACYQGSSLPGGKIDFAFRIGGKQGKIDSITVTAPPGLSVFGIVPCARKAVANHQFPIYSGPPMTVKYSIDIGE
jgi:hypothetical protein